MLVFFFIIIYSAFSFARFVSVCVLATMLQPNPIPIASCEAVSTNSFWKICFFVQKIIKIQQTELVEWTAKGETKVELNTVYIPVIFPFTGGSRLLSLGWHTRPNNEGIYWPKPGQLGAVIYSIFISYAKRVVQTQRICASTWLFCCYLHRFRHTTYASRQNLVLLQRRRRRQDKMWKRTSPRHH